MRNPRRIPLVLGLLSKYWMRCPDMTLGELLFKLAKDKGLEDPSQLEDEDLEDLLTRYNK